LKAAATDGQGNVWLADAPVPEPNDYQCLCETLACATCTGTDIKHIHNKLPWKQDYPGLLGHESVGRVIEVGRRVRAFRKGDMVLRPAAVYPGERLGGFSSMWGGFAEYGLIADAAAMKADNPDAKPNNYTRFQQVVPADLGISPADATMLITLKETASYVAAAGAGLYKSAAILGVGAVALSMCRFAKVFGADPVIVVGRRDDALARARRIGADVTVNTATEDPVAAVKRATGGRGADLILDATGDAAFLKACMAALAPDGKAAPYATYETKDTIRQMIDPARLVAAGTGEDRAHPYLLDATRLGLVNLADYYSHRFPLSRIREGFDMLKRKEAFKIVFEMEK
jgi:threonine dehydrogenase-like Zn-dependent dehydrogenase